jgi:23S rRNA (guanosine2251-2'-O)-methyltransferase
MTNKHLHRKPKFQQNNRQWLYGINSVEAAILRSNRQHFALWLKQPHGERLKRLQKIGEEKRIPVKIGTPEIFETHCPNGVHQGVLLECSARRLGAPTSLPITQNLNPFYLVLDQIKDPQNFGAILRSAAFFDCSGCVITKDNSPGVTPSVSKASVGVAEWFPIFETTNLARFLTDQKKIGFWIVGLAGDGKADLRKLERDRPLLIVLGNEGRGLRPLVKQQCDWDVRIDGAEQVESLNVSVAAALACYQLGAPAPGHYTKISDRL